MAQVIVMATDHHRLVGMRTTPFQNANHVLGLDARPVDYDLRGQGPALQLMRTWLQVAVDVFL